MTQTPHELAEHRVKLAAEYARDSELLSDVLEQKAAMWMTIRDTVKSDRSADKLWDSTALGVNEMKLRLKMKSAEREMSAIKTMLDVLNAESRNLM